MFMAQVENRDSFVGRVAPPLPSARPSVVVLVSTPPAHRASPVAMVSVSSAGSANTPQGGSSESLNVDKKESKGFFGMTRSKTQKKETKKLDKSMISAPSDFKHLSHVGYDPKKGFSAANIPLEWKAIFQKAGITEDQLQDKRTAKIVAKFMKQHADAAAQPAGPAAPSSNQAPVSKRAPPPPPPSRGSSILSVMQRVQGLPRHQFQEGHQLRTRLLLEECRRPQCQKEGWHQLSLPGWEAVRLHPHLLLEG